jgi:signal transduction histidine kinase
MERRILVAEDSPTQAEHLRLLLEAEAYRVELVPNGREGLARLQLAPPDLVISDVVMPEMDGYAFCRAVKSSERTRRIPFVLLTERNAPADVIKGLERGADNFITKPFEDDYLRERVRRIFDNLDLRRQGHLDVEVTLRVGRREITINADKQQIMELLFATLEDVVRKNGQLLDAQRAVEEYARGLEAKVQERTQQLLQAEKVATMGQLLAGVAHELNNPLAVVIGQASLLQQTSPTGPTATRAAKIAQAAERCSRIVKNFLALARQRPLERQETRLNQVVQEAVELLAYPLRVDSVEVRLELGGDLPPLWADPHQLHQVVVNLVSNAQHALRGASPPRQLVLRTRYDPSRHGVVLTVSDTGPGIAPEIQSRIFEPFFTTKPVGQGTGLGLSLCQGIVESHRGTIRVESQPGRGASFRIELPVVAVPQGKSGDPSDGAAAPIRGKAILVVDDEPEICGILAEILSEGGHEVEVAANGVVALEKLARRAYDLILTDLRMPDLDGPGLYRELARRRRDLLSRVIFLTGDTLSPEVTAFLDEVRVPTCSKPFDVAHVCATVQEALRRLEPR